MDNDAEPTDHQGNAEHHENNPKQEHIRDRVERTPENNSANKGEKASSHNPKPSFSVRAWHILWRRRIWPFNRFHHRPYASWAEIITICVTVTIVLVGSIQAYIYWKQEGVMEQSLRQTGAQLALTNRAAKTAEDTLQEIRNEQRPWIVVKDAKITTLEANKNVTDIPPRLTQDLSVPFSSHRNPIKMSLLPPKYRLILSLRLPPWTCTSLSIRSIPCLRTKWKEPNSQM